MQRHGNSVLFHVNFLSLKTQQNPNKESGHTLLRFPLPPRIANQAMTGADRPPKAPVWATRYFLRNFQSFPYKPHQVPFDFLIRKNRLANASVTCKYSEFSLSPLPGSFLT